jgi:glycosyltransferase involved in cell wall biosynthesis
MYGDDYIWEFNNTKIAPGADQSPKDYLASVFSEINAKKKIMVLNYRRGAVGQVEWTKNWDRYLFLNSNQEAELLRVHPEANTKVLAPCADLTDFFAVEPNYLEPGIRIVRVSSQGNTKFQKDENDFSFKGELERMLASREDLQIGMMPGPSFIPTERRYFRVERNKVTIPNFLAQGNLFWYSLPQGYQDMGPRVILEAMAVGLPILADNWGGAVDRVTPDCGWLCNGKEEMVKIVQNVTVEELKQKGQAAKKRAMQHFVTHRWIEEITERVAVPVT